MARQPRTRTPKVKFRKLCPVCNAEKTLIQTVDGWSFRCRMNPSHR